MTMFEPSQQTFWSETELPLMSSRAGSRAKISAQQEGKPESEREPAADFGPKSCDLLASYDRATSSWRTSQTCLVALAIGEADGLAEFSETWPSAGMMRNGVTYRLGWWDCLISENVSGLWPTPSRNDGRGFYRLSLRSARLRLSGQVKRQLHWLHRAVLMQSREGSWTACPRFAMGLMGFPTWWVDLERPATQSSRKSPN